MPARKDRKVARGRSVRKDRLALKGSRDSQVRLVRRVLPPPFESCA
jgi:hypothetical protein